jgi:hypothetical protein
MQVLSLLVNHKCPYFWLSWFTRPLVPLDLIFSLEECRIVELVCTKRSDRNTWVQTRVRRQKEPKKSSIWPLASTGGPIHTRVEWNGVEKINVYTARCLTSSGSGPPSEHQSSELISGFTLVNPFGKKVGHIHR